MKRSRFLILAFVIAVAAECIAWQQMAGPRASVNSYQVNGVVVHGITREPLAGVTVMLAPNVDAPRLGAPVRRPRPEARAPEIPPVLTASDGSFSFAGLKPGKYSLSGAKRGFTRQGFNQHEQYSSAIVVGPGKDSANLLFLLQPDASIGGRIVDEHNDPVANAQVLLFREGVQNGRRGIYRAQQVQSSDDGTYRVPRLRPGKYYLAVLATPWYAQYQNGRPGRFFVDGSAPPQQVDDNSSELDLAFPLTLYPGVTDSARAESIVLRAGQRENVDFALTAVPSLHIRVNAPTGEGQQFVTANLVQQVFDNVDVAGLNMRGRNMSFGQGVTEISGITPGHYLLQLRTNGPNRTPVPMDVRELDITSNLEINATEVPPGVNVSGTLRFEGPAPEGPLRLVLRRKSFPQPVQLQVSASGVISSEHPVPPDTYDLSLGNNYGLLQIAAKGAKLKGQSIQFGSQDAKLTLVAARASGRVEGVAMKDGKPLAGAMIVLVPQDTDRLQLYRRDQSDSDGTFTLPAIPPGKYTVLALENGWDMEWSKAEVLNPYFASGETVQVAADGKYQVTVTVQ